MYLDHKTSLDNKVIILSNQPYGSPASLFFFTIVVVADKWNFS
jgi:hypothetical protein